MARGATPCGAADTVSTALLRVFVASAVLAQSARAQSLAPASHLNHSGGVYWDSHYRDSAAVATEISRCVERCSGSGSVDVNVSTAARHDVRR